MTTSGTLVSSGPPRESDLARELRRMNDRMDVLSRQVDHLYRRTVAAEELKDELVPVLRDAIAAASEKLGEMETEFNSEEVAHLMRKALRSTPRFIRLLDHLENLESLVDEVQPLSRDVVRTAVEFLQRAEDRGWFRLMSGGMELFDRVASQTSQEDVDRLADNLMLIVHTVKRMTQPEVLKVANNALSTLEPEHEPPPRVTFWGLMRAMREPEIQEGIGMLLEMTRQMARRPQGARSNGTSVEETSNG